MSCNPAITSDFPCCFCEKYQDGPVELHTDGCAEYRTFLRPNAMKRAHVHTENVCVCVCEKDDCLPPELKIWWLIEKPNKKCLAKSITFHYRQFKGKTIYGHWSVVTGYHVSPQQFNSSHCLANFIEKQLKPELRTIETICKKRQICQLLVSKLSRQCSPNGVQTFHILNMNSMFFVLGHTTSLWGAWTCHADFSKLLRTTQDQWHPTPWKFCQKF